MTGEGRCRLGEGGGGAEEVWFCREGTGGVVEVRRVGAVRRTEGFVWGGCVVGGRECGDRAQFHGWLVRRGWAGCKWSVVGSFHARGQQVVYAETPSPCLHEYQKCEASFTQMAFLRDDVSQRGSHWGRRHHIFDFLCAREMDPSWF